jgi:GNAT superfamily N-acetyltransferase
MRSRHEEMSLEQFLLLPRKEGWKYEYYEGKAHVTPRHISVNGRLLLRPREVACPYPLVVPAASHAALLESAFFESFFETHEFCDWSAERTRSFAQSCISAHFAGDRGTPLPSSRVAFAPEPGSGREVVAGAAMLTWDPEEQGPMLDLLFVAPPWQRMGVANALVGAAGNALLESGERFLSTKWALGNEPSADWHRRFGFIEVPDPYLDRLRQAADLGQEPAVPARRS